MKSTGSLERRTPLTRSLSINGMVLGVVFVKQTLGRTNVSTDVEHSRDLHVKVVTTPAPKV
jgi:hypothetical protein